VMNAMRALVLPHDWLSSTAIDSQALPEIAQKMTEDLIRTISRVKEEGRILKGRLEVIIDPRLYASLRICRDIGGILNEAVRKAGVSARDPDELTAASAEETEAASRTIVDASLIGFQSWCEAEKQRLAQQPAEAEAAAEAKALGYDTSDRSRRELLQLAAEFKGSFRICFIYIYLIIYLFILFIYFTYLFIFTYFSHFTRVRTVCAHFTNHELFI
jgi:hypothetical protein